MATAPNANRVRGEKRQISINAPADFSQQLGKFRSAGERFTLGVVSHTGRQRVVIGDRLIAAPVSALWG